MTMRSGWVNGVLAVGLVAAMIVPGVASIARAGDDAVSFAAAKPVWVTDRQTEKNLFVGFRAAFENPGQATPALRITASTLYRVYLNGQFVGHGPARGPHGYWRVDEWPLDGCRQGRNVVAVEVAGYNVNSYYLLDEPAFLQAEVICDGEILASTAGQDVPFEAMILKQRVQKVQRYSFQRPFIEYYRLKAGDDQWWSRSPAAGETAACSVQDTKSLLVRRVAYPRFFVRQP
ncbi:MAG: hypothetical protein ACM3VT_10325, partial [Solirubrobacterales bacterium]